MGNVDEGLAYCLASLGQRGVDLPRDREIFRIDVQRMLCGLSIAGRGGGKDLLKKLALKGVVCDFREPNVIRAAPVPL